MGRCATCATCGGNGLAGGGKASIAQAPALFSGRAGAITKGARRCATRVVNIVSISERAITTVTYTKCWWARTFR